MPTQLEIPIKHLLTLEIILRAKLAIIVHENDAIHSRPPDELDPICTANNGR